MKREIGGAGMAGGLSETPFYAVISYSELGDASRLQILSIADYSPKSGALERRSYSCNNLCMRLND